MRSIMLSLTDDHDKRSWRANSLVVLFLLLTLAWRASYREQAALLQQVYTSNNDTFFLAIVIVLSLAQFATLAILLQPETQREELPNRESLVIFGLSHIGFTFLQDFLASVGYSQNSLSIAFCLPLLTLLLVWAVTSVSMRLSTWLSVLVICCGCTFMTLRPSAVTSTDRTSLICALSGSGFILRNIVIRQLVCCENGNIKFRGSLVITTFFSLTLLLFIAMFFSVDQIWFAPVLCLFASCLVGTALTYVTGQLLKGHSVHQVALFQVWTLLLEALALTPIEDRPDLFMCILALSVVLLGHYLYLKDFMDHQGTGNSIAGFAQKPVNVHEQYTRIEFLLFFLSVLGVIFYVFQPQVSQRDLNTLSYVGLDRVIRRLLSIPDTAAGDQA